MKEQNNSDLQALLQILPEPIRQALEQDNKNDGLLEIILDLGRVPEARFLGREAILSDQEVTRQDIEHVVSKHQRL